MITSSIHATVLRNRFILIAIVLAIILIPFFLFGSRIEGWTNEVLYASGQNKIWTALVLAIMLTLDIFLPVPASIVSTGCGFLLGFINGTMVSFAGMTLGCLLGYAFGFNSRRALQWLGKDELNKMERLFKGSGFWAIILARPVPVLAEASVIFAGISKMNRFQFMMASVLSNLGISMVYGLVGAYSVSVNSFLLAFAGAMLMPATARLILVYLKKTRRI